MWLCWHTLDLARLFKLHSSVSVESGMPYHEQNQTAVSYNSQFLTKIKADTSVAVDVFVRNLQINARRHSSK